ncbi:hypothetical protein tb265_38920 [Gemmatimonadetes bacterium T265]|nr:hypothetical protein tb265_38920 [Gemmatimonadetes bacterium T265]
MAARKAAAKAAAKVPAKRTRRKVATVPQPHGGALAVQGTPGNQGGPGRPKNEVRAAALEGADEAIPVLRGIVLDAKLRTKRPAVVVLAADKLLKYGLGTQKEVSIDEVKGRLRKTIDLARELLPPDLFRDFAARLHTVWR